MRDAAGTTGARHITSTSDNIDEIRKGVHHTKETRHG